VAALLRHGRVTSGATARGTPGERQDCGQRVPLAPRVAKIRHLGHDLEQWPRWWYQRSSSLIAFWLEGGCHVPVSSMGVKRSIAPLTPPVNCSIEN
jgi:hypothetical protein